MSSQIKIIDNETNSSSTEMESRAGFISLEQAAYLDGVQTVSEQWSGLCHCLRMRWKERKTLRAPLPGHLETWTSINCCDWLRRLTGLETCEPLDRMLLDQLFITLTSLTEGSWWWFGTYRDSCMLSSQVQLLSPSATPPGPKSEPYHWPYHCKDSKVNNRCSKSTSIATPLGLHSDGSQYEGRGLKLRLQGWLSGYEYS